LKALAKWRPSPAVRLILLLPLLLKLPVLVGLSSIDPIFYTAGVGDVVNLHGGYPWIDPNVGFQAQALGKLSADNLLHGHMPWWNPYNGVGLPLAAEAQPASLFLPFVLLQHFQSGFLWVQIILQIIAGLCAYLFFKKLGLTELAAMTGGLLYELNGTFAWFGLPITGPIAFLPMLLLGTESLLQRINDKRAGGWWPISLALTWSIYAGFPETAYIDALFVAFWILFRLFDIRSGARFAYIGKLVLAVFVGLACSSLLIFPFAHYLSHALVGGHDGSVGQAALEPSAVALTLIPRLFGPIFQFRGPAGAVSAVWGNIGGYLPALQVMLALLALQWKPKRIVLAPLIWIMLSLGKTFGVHPISNLLNVLPLMKTVAFYRYSAPSWEFAGAILACIGIDAIQRGLVSKHRQSLLAVAVVVACLVAALWLAWPSVVWLKANRPSADYVSAAIITVVITLSVGFGILLSQRRWKLAAHGLAVLLIFDAAAAFAAPLGSSVNEVSSHRAGLDYLRAHIGLQRTFTLGPMAPNYGAYFQIAQINHNYLPLSSDWGGYVKQHLDPGVELLFTGYNNRLPGFGSPTEQLRDRLPAYEEAGVKYVLAPHGDDPLSQSGADYRLAYDGPDMSIYELPGVKPYFEVIKGNCSVWAAMREAVKLHCAGVAELVRREAFFPGWSATVNGASVSIRRVREIFQSIPLVEGENDVVFSYRPPNYWLMLATFWIGAAALLLAVAKDFLRWREEGP
jgi:hypothetical protein